MVLSEALHTTEAHLGVQKCPGLLAKKQSLRPGSETPAGDPEAVVPGQRYMSLLLSSVIICFSSFAWTFCLL